MIPSQQIKIKMAEVLRKNKVPEPWYLRYKDGDSEIIELLNPRRNIMAKCKTYLITKEVTTDAKKSAIREWEKQENVDDSTCWKIKGLTIEKLESLEDEKGCC